MKKFGTFLLAKDSHAIIIAFLCALLPIFYIPTGFIGAIIVGLVTLQKGAKSGLNLLAWVALPAIALLVLRQWGIVDVFILRCVLIFGFALLLRQGFTWSILLEWATLIGILLIIGLHLLVPNIQAWWVAHLTSYISRLIPAADWKMTLTPAQFAEHLAPYVMGIIAFLFLINVFMELLIARFWQSRVIELPMISQEFTLIRVGNIAIIVAAAMLLLAALKVTMAFDALALVVLPFFWAGLSLLHYIAQRRKQMRYALLVIYIGLFFLPAFVISAISTLALIDVWGNFRNRIRET